MKKIFYTYRIYLFILVAISLICGNTLKAQSVNFEVKIDTSEFLIGDQVGLDLLVTQPANVFVGIPVFNEELTKQIEILEQSENDTTLMDNGDWLIKKRLLITAFDSGYYALPPIPVLYYSDTIKSEPVLFKVNTIQVDTTQAIKDIKMPYNAPLSFAEVLPWAGGSIGLAIIILILIYVIRKLKRKEPIIRRVKPQEPAHIIALRDLNKLKENKLWQKDRIKKYYTELTDIIRVYLWNRYSVRTLERTSEEILKSLQSFDIIDEESFNTLKEIFYNADLVKFAKYKPLADQHINYMDNAFDFVEKTKLIIEDKPSSQIDEVEGKKLTVSSEKIEENNILDEKVKS